MEALVIVGVLLGSYFLLRLVCRFVYRMISLIPSSKRHYLVLKFTVYIQRIDNFLRDAAGFVILLAFAAGILFGILWLFFAALEYTGILKNQEMSIRENHQPYLEICDSVYGLTRIDNTSSNFRRRPIEELSEAELDALIAEHSRPKRRPIDELHKGTIEDRKARLECVVKLSQLELERDRNNFWYGIAGTIGFFLIGAGWYLRRAKVTSALS